ncbi:hypothetical protein HBB16_18280 [Pseudonocardia sp. MCCB 268]|nr:hypothetical protein [Pseudonocardia cytotoxica]
MLAEAVAELGRSRACSSCRKGHRRRDTATSPGRSADLPAAAPARPRAVEPWHPELRGADGPRSPSEVVRQVNRWWLFAGGNGSRGGACGAGAGDHR